MEVKLKPYPASSAVYSCAPQFLCSYCPLIIQKAVTSMRYCSLLFFPLFFLFFVNYTTKVEGFLKKGLRKMGYGTEGSVIGMKRVNTHLLFPNLLFYIRNTTFYSCKVSANIANTPSYLAVKVQKKQCGDSL